MSDLSEKQSGQEPSPVNHRRDISESMVSGSNNLLSNAVVTVNLLPGRRSFKKATAMDQPKLFIETASCVVYITHIPNDKLVAMEAQVYKGG